MGKRENNAAVRRLGRRNIQEHFLRNILIIAVIALLAGSVSALNVLGTSAYYNIQSFYMQQYGSKGHVRIENISDAKIRELEKYSEVKGLGKSILIADAVNEEFHGKSVEIRYSDGQYAEYTFSKPTQGRMPKTLGEAAVDTDILKDLGIENGIGQSIELDWIENGKTIRKTFQITGIWECSKVTSVHKIWVSDAILKDSQGIEKTVELMFKSADIRKSAEAMIQKLQIEEDACHINEIYDENVSQSIETETLAYKVGAAAVLICGLLIIHSIIHVAYVTDIKLYGRMKALGATPRQIRKSLVWQNAVLSVPGIGIGVVIGVVGAKLMLPIVFQNLQIAPNLYIEWQDYILAALFVYFLVIAAAIKPAFSAGKINPSDLLGEEGHIYFKGKAERRIPGVPVLFQMALYNMGRNKKKNILAVFLLILGILSVGSIYVIHKSFDIDIYMKEIALSDFTLSERTLMDTWGEYDPEGTTLSTDVLKDIRGLDGVYEMGTLYSKDISLNLPDHAYGNITRYYEQNDGEVLEYMGHSVGWTEGYYSVRDHHKCAATVYGVDGIINDRLAERGRVLEGKVDKEKFLSGKYVLAQGIEEIEPAYAQPTYSVGDIVEIEGRAYEVMAIISAPYPVTEGNISPGYEFSLQFFMPSSEFCELYPDNTVRRVFLNVDSDEKENIQAYLEGYTDRNNIPMISEKSVEMEYRKETSASMAISNILAGMILFIGAVNMVHVEITSVNMRKKEFAMMQSLGMTKKQLRILLLFEGMGIAAVALLISYFLSFFVIHTVVSAYLETKWTAAYNYTITPLLIITPILILIVVGVPILCFNQMQKEEIMQRLYPWEK
ncbi:MAG TPA: ABC transporter permease [Lachnospiraceae bacterium]|nr:ABC transporter permease [Lachnospiraceae bacterium]